MHRISGWSDTGIRSYPGIMRPFFKSLYPAGNRIWKTHGEQNTGKIQWKVKEFFFYPSQKSFCERKQLDIRYPATTNTVYPAGSRLFGYQIIRLSDTYRYLYNYLDIKSKICVCHTGIYYFMPHNAKIRYRQSKDFGQKKRFFN